MVGRSGFEPLKAKPADLQSAPVGHLGTYPFLAEGPRLWALVMLWQELFRGEGMFSSTAYLQP